MQAEDLTTAWDHESYWPSGWSEEQRTTAGLEAAWDEIAIGCGAEVVRWCRGCGMTLADAEAYGLWNHQAPSAPEIASIQRWWQEKRPVDEVELYLAVGLSADDIAQMRPEHIRRHLDQAYDDGLGPLHWRRAIRRERLAAARTGRT